MAKNEMTWPWPQSTLFGLLVRSASFAGFTKFGDLKAGLDRLFVLRGVVIHLTALCALQFDEVVLRHMGVVISFQWSGVRTEN